MQILVAMASYRKTLTEGLVVRTAYVHGEHQEPIYLDHSEGFLDNENLQLLCRLKKSLYGLK